MGCCWLIAETVVTSICNHGCGSSRTSNCCSTLTKFIPNWLHSKSVSNRALNFLTCWLDMRSEHIPCAPGAIYSWGPVHLMYSTNLHHFRRSPLCNIYQLWLHGKLPQLLQVFEKELVHWLHTYLRGENTKYPLNNWLIMVALSQRLQLFCMWSSKWSSCPSHGEDI